MFCWNYSFCPFLSHLSDDLEQFQRKSFIILVEGLFVNFDLETFFNNLDGEFLEILHSRVDFFNYFVLLELSSNQHGNSVFRYWVSHFHVIKSALKNLNQNFFGNQDGSFELDIDWQDVGVDVLVSLFDQSHIAFLGLLGIENDIIVDYFVEDSFESFLDLLLFSFRWFFLFRQEELLSPGK